MMITRDHLRPWAQEAWDRGCKAFSSFDLKHPVLHEVCKMHVGELDELPAVLRQAIKQSKFGVPVSGVAQIYHEQGVVAALAAIRVKDAANSWKMYQRGLRAEGAPE